MRLPNSKKLLAVVALVFAALLVATVFALNAANKSKSPGVGSSQSPTSTSSLLPSPSADTSSKGCLVSTSGVVTCDGQVPFCTDGAPCDTNTPTPPFDRSTCPVTVSGVTKCPGDPYCPGGEGCETGLGQSTEMPSPSLTTYGPDDPEWWGSDN